MPVGNWVDQFDGISRSACKISNQAGIGHGTDHALFLSYEIPASHGDDIDSTMEDWKLLSNLKPLI